MTERFYLILAVCTLLAAGCDQPSRGGDREDAMSDNADTPTSMPALNDHERHVIINKGTERAFSGTYWNHFEAGAYVCRQCGATLYESDTKFESQCGWPSFDDEVPGAVKRVPDADGLRTEIVCAACDGHLGHVFVGENLTDKNTRHCVNSVSIVFVPAGRELEPTSAPAPQTTQRAYFAGGCFWGVENHFDLADGVISAQSGYMGGSADEPTYKQVCSGQTGHAEAVEVVFDPAKVTFEQLAKLFFEIHDPTQVGRQGPDVGTQYRPAVFYVDDQQWGVAEKLIAQLRELGYDVATELVEAQTFWPAEDYHQDYFQKHPGHPTCHVPKARFETPADSQ